MEKKKLTENEYNYKKMFDLKLSLWVYVNSFNYLCK